MLAMHDDVVRVWRGHLDEREEDFYQALYTQSQAQFNTYVHSGTVLNNYAHIFDILIRLRQAVDHPYLVIYGDKQHAATVAAASSSSTNSNGFVVRVNKNSTSKKDVEDELECVLCHETSEDPVQATCHHVFCRLCVTDYLDTLIGKAPPDTDDKETGEGSVDDEDYGMAKKRKKPTNNTKNSVKPKVLCPACNKELTIDLTSSIDADISPRDPDSHVGVWDVSKPRANSILSRIDLSLFQSSTKMEALMQVGQALTILFSPDDKMMRCDRFILTRIHTNKL
jgi:DNA repair protein RAD16